MHLFNPREEGRSLEFGASWSTGEFQGNQGYTEKPCLQKGKRKKKKKKGKRKTETPPHTHPSVSMVIINVTGVCVHVRTCGMCYEFACVYKHMCVSFLYG